jgi:hypothetical protein
VQVYDPDGKLCMDVSLFERLVNNKLPVHELLVQRRMRPEISNLIQTIYPKLKDGPEVENYPPVSGAISSHLAPTPAILVVERHFSRYKGHKFISDKCGGDQ